LVYQIVAIANQLLLKAH